MSDAVTAIEVVNARTHNLKGVDCRVPHGKVTVVTGPSGAGKSSLAFDTIFAEGQRRFVESMSTYARQFLDQMERPPVDEVRNIQPAVALEAKNAVRNARSTVGTITEAYDVLRLLFAHLGEVECPNGHGPVARHQPEEVAASAAAGEAGERFSVVARVERPKKRADEALGELVRQGFLRRLDEAGGELVRLETGARWPKALDPLPLVLGRFQAGAAVARLAATIEDAYRLGRGRVELHGEGGAAGDGAVRHYGRELTCPVCGATLRRPTPALFSFNSPLGACDTCQGFGRIIGIDRKRVVPDPTRTLVQGAIAPWNTPAYEDLYDELHAAAKQRGVPLDVPWEELSEEDRRWVWSGEGFTNLDGFFAWLEKRSYRVHVRVLLARYRSYDRCPDCGGTRLQPEARRRAPQRPHACRSWPRCRWRTCAAGWSSSRGRRASASSPATCWRRSASASRCCTGWASTTSPSTARRAPCPAARPSASTSPPPSARGSPRPSTCSTSRPSASIRRTRRSSWRCSATSPGVATRCWWSSTTAR